LEQPIRVRILEQEYLVRSDGDEEGVQKIARFVDECLRRVRAGSEGLPEKKAAILAAFNIASEYFQAVEEKEALAKDIQARAAALVRQIEQSL